MLRTSEHISSYAYAKQVRCTRPLQGSCRLSHCSCRLICITSMLIPISLHALVHNATGKYRYNHAEATGLCSQDSTNSDTQKKQAMAKQPRPLIWHPAEKRWQMRSQCNIVVRNIDVISIPEKGGTKARAAEAFGPICHRRFTRMFFTYRHVTHNFFHTQTFHPYVLHPTDCYPHMSCFFPHQQTFHPYVFHPQVWYPCMFFTHSLFTHICCSLVCLTFHPYVFHLQAFHP